MERWKKKGEKESKEERGNRSRERRRIKLYRVVGVGRCRCQGDESGKERKRANERRTISKPMMAVNTVNTVIWRESIWFLWNMQREIRMLQCFAHCDALLRVECE